MPDHVAYRAQAEPREAFLELGPDERQVGEREPQHEVRLRARGDHVHASGRRARYRLGDARGELGHELRGRAPDRQRQRGLREHRVADAAGRRGERLVVVQALRAREVEVELVARGLLHGRSEASQHGRDLAALVGASLPGHRYDRRAGTEPHGARHRHRGVDAVGPRFIRCRGDHAAAVGRAADDQEPRLARTVRVHEPRHRDVEGVCIGQQDPPARRHRGGGAVRVRRICSTTRRRSGRSSRVS